MRRALGWLPDPAKHDDEQPDHDFAALSLVAAPPSATLRPFVVSILDQGGLGSCVANAGFQAIRISHVRQAANGSPVIAAAIMAQKPPELGSRLWGYYFARAIHHMTAFDSGTHLRSFFQAINALGFPPESAWPYSDDKGGDRPRYTRQPKTNAFRLAADQRAPTVYRRIFTEGADRIDDVKLAIANGYAVAFGIDVSDDFCDNLIDPSKPLDPPTGAIAGGHAMTAIGYDGDTFEIMNSWGDDWGDRGYFLASASFLEAGRDLWTVEHAPRYASEP
jgi:C1A family cysteine protease